MLDSLASAPGKPAFEHGDRVVTRAELLDLVGRRISALRNVGITAGTGVGITTAVTPEAFALHLAALCVGARVLGLRPGLTAAQLPHVVDGLAAVVVDETTATPELLAAAPRILHLADLVGAYEQPRAHGRAEDVAVLVLTSGSTGTPKCAAMTYGALSTQWSWHPRTWDARTAAFGAKFRRFLLFGTLTSAVVQDFLGICLSAGGTAVIPVGLPDFPADFARLRPTASLLTVPRLHHVLDSLRTRPVDLSSLEALVVAGSPLTAHRLTEAYELIGPAVHHAYGQTELGLITVLTHADVLAHPEAAHSVGRVWPGVGLEVREGGEIWVRAPYQTAGYWRDARETAEILHEGWLRTRDLGRVDENGFLYLTGRARDIVIVNAIVHYAGAIEAALTAHPAVDQAYVVSTPDERTGEAAHAFVVPVRGASVDLDSLRAEVRTRLGPSAVPAGITMINEVPVTPAGKPDKKALVRLRTGAPARSAG